MAQFTFEHDVVPLVRAYAGFWFRHHPDRETKIADVLSVAWEFAQTASTEATAMSVTWYAIARVRQGRQFRQSIRSVDGPHHPRQVKPDRSGFDVGAIARTGDDPATVAAFRVDFREWLESLTPRMRAVLLALAQGDRTSEVAELFGVSPGRVSQIRRELAENWEAFTA